MNPHTECRRIHALGLEQRTKGGFEKGRLPFVLLPMPEGEPVPPLVLSNGLSDVGRRALKLASKVLGLTQMPAALVQSDIHQLLPERFGAYFHLSPTLSAEEFLDEYSRILERDYQGTMENLPAECHTDAVMTLVKGPKIQQLLLISTYKAGEGDTVVYEPVSESCFGEAYMLPDWWRGPVQ